MMKLKFIIYQEINEGGHHDGVEATKIRISDEATKQREEGGNANPSVYILGSFSDGLVKHICEVCDQIRRQAYRSKLRCKFHTYKEKLIIAS